MCIRDRFKIKKPCSGKIPAIFRIKEVFSRSPAKKFLSAGISPIRVTTKIGNRDFLSKKLNFFISLGFEKSVSKILKDCPSAFNIWEIAPAAQKRPLPVTMIIQGLFIRKMSFLKKFIIIRAAYL